MDIGNRIKMLRLRRGVTQEAMAQHFGLTAQAVSKWECGASLPDITMLPTLSAYFGVSIDELFALSDETRMERIQNMLYDVRVLNPADVENERQFLLEKVGQKPENSLALELLSNLELHLAEEHNARAAEYALEAMKRSPLSSRGLTALAHAMGGKHVDPRNNVHNALICHYKTHLVSYPNALDAYAWLIAQLIDDGRLMEARHYCEKMAQQCDSYFVTVQWIKLAIAERDIPTAKALWAQMEAESPENWSVQHWIGDFQTQIGDYAAAKESYRRALALMQPPHYTDPLDSLAKACEIDGDMAGAIAAREWELKIAETEWGDTTGESVDEIRRELHRLERLFVNA